MDNPNLLLHQFLGEWEGETATWFDPTAPKIPGRTLTRFTSLLDGLFIQESYQGILGERSHAGNPILGYDARHACYTCYWLDSFHTGATAMSLDQQAFPKIPKCDHPLSAPTKDQESTWVARCNP